MGASRRLVAVGLLFVAPVLSAACEAPPRSAGEPRLAAAPASVAVTAATVLAPTYAEPRWQRAPGPPLTLTASDGSGLALRRLSARAVVSEPLAFTELHVAFDNPRDRTIEGTFSITLPPRASIARFAMRVGSSWQEGEVIERQTARRAYEDFLHKKQDPALLEQAAGNQFSARVFPIPARGEKELVIAYTEELEGGAPYTLALKGLPEVAELDVSVTGDGVAEQEIRESRTTPSGDLVFDRRAAAKGDGLRSGNLVAVRVRPLGDADASPDAIKGLMVLVDTSGSRALGFRDQLELVRGLAATLAATDPSLPLSVACYDQDVEAVFSGPASAFGDKEVAAMQARAALGASDVEHALGWAREHATEHGAARVLLVTDGVATAGATEAEPLRASAAALRSVGVERLDVVAVGGIRDEAALKGLVTAGLPRDGVVVDGGVGAKRIAQRLRAATRSGIAVRVEGAAFSYPSKLDGMQPGDEAVVYAEVDGASDVRVAIDDAAPVAVHLGEADAPLLDRALAQAHIARLLEQEAAQGKSAELEHDIVGLAVGHRIVTPYTALLVLETDADYARYGIEQRGLAAILNVEDGKLVASARGSLAPRAKLALATETAPNKAAGTEGALRVAGPPRGAPAEAPVATATAETRTGGPPPAQAVANFAGQAWADGVDNGGLGLSGIGEGGGGAMDASGSGMGLGSIGTVGHGAGTATGEGQGFGSGHGRLGGAHQSAAPRLRQGATQVSGALAVEVIQRIVRQNFGRFRLCYESGLRSDPRLEGRVSVSFLIGKDGTVASAADAGSDLPDSQVVGCVVRAFGTLSFPEPAGGDVRVTYPMTFAPGDGSLASVPDDPTPVAAPYTGKLREVMDRLAHDDAAGARRTAEAWHDKDPGDILGLVALGEALEAGHDTGRAARAYGSLIDLFPARADMRRFAGSRLERVKVHGADALALDSYKKAKAERPDHPSSHRLLAYALLKSGAPAEAFAAAVEGLRRHYPEGRFPGVHRILQEDVGLIGAAWAKAAPGERSEIMARIKDVGGVAENGPSIRFVLTWETDANDVDFHIRDASGGHAYYGAKHLASGGDLYADITTGYGPECFTIRGAAASRSSRYTLQANYYSRGPMGYGMGKLEVIDHDGSGGLTFEERPYVVMVDHAFVDLGVVKR